jgi:hypothetical protein
MDLAILLSSKQQISKMVIPFLRKVLHSLENNQSTINIKPFFAHQFFVEIFLRKIKGKFLLTKIIADKKKIHFQI